MLESGFFKINNTVVVDPTALTVLISDISSSDTGRSIDGTMNKDIVAVKRTLSCTWTQVPLDKMQTLINALKQEIYFNVTYPDPQEGIGHTIKCYCGDIKPQYKGADNSSIYWSLTLNLIER